MEFYIADQVRLLAGSVLLGLCGGVVYDLLRALRGRVRRLRGLLDLLYCLACGAALFLFILQAADGVLQLYVLLGCGGGCVLYFSLLSDLLRPLWDFWVDALAFLGKLLLLPIKTLRKFLKKCVCRGKNLFLFSKKWGTILNYKWTVVRIHRKGESARMAKPTKKRPKSGVLTKLLILALLLGLGMQLHRLQGEIQTAQADQEQLAAQVEQKRQENAALAQDIENGDDQELMEEIAREELGLVNPGEKVFYDYYSN